MRHTGIDIIGDVPERKKVDAALREEAGELRRVNRTLKALGRSGQALLRATDEAAYLREVCRIVVEDCGHAMVWVGYAEQDETRTVRPVAYSGFEEGYLETLRITWSDTERGRGPTGTAIRTGQPSTCRHMLTDPVFLPWREEAIRRGYASSIVLPLLDSGKAFGALTIYSREPDPFSEDETRLLTELAGDFAYGITVLRLRAAHARAEQDLRREFEQRRLTLEAADMGAWDYRFDAGEVFWDARCRDMWGIPSGGRIDYAEAIARIHPGDRTAVDDAVRKAISGENGGAYRTEFRVVWLDESLHWVASHGRVYFAAEGGKAVRFLGVTLDITESKKAEDALRQAQKLESIGVLAGGIAHDFNNLLVGVIGNASLAQDSLPPGSPAAEILQRVVESGEQAAQLTRQMLAYAGKGRFLFEPVDIPAMVREAAALIQSSISKRISLSLDLDAATPAVDSDRSQMQQVFMNLALNAAEAIGSGPGEISIRTGEAALDAAQVREHLDGWPAAPGRFAFLEVKDTGCGMAAATAAKIFDPFFTTKFQGRGLGLAAVAGIVRAHRGAIRLTTAPGQGATFRVLLPAAAAPAAVAPPPAPHSEALAGSGTILVVDDEELVRDLARRSLELYGYEVLVASSGAAALAIEATARDRIRLVLLDLSMPDMGGEEVLPLLREINPNLEVIVSSGYSEMETMRLFRGARISGFLQKPYTVRELARKAKAALTPAG